jgi:hypothetical protein
MKILAQIPTIFASSIVVAFICNTLAWADGSMGLGEVLLTVRAAPMLVAEIADELNKNGLIAENVFCLGARHGRHWKYLGGMRAAPYHCKIGNRELTIEADRVYFDVRGRNIGDLDRASPEKAKTFRESNFHWKWTEETGR